MGIHGEEVRSFLRACRARPSAGGKRGREGFRGKPGDNVEVGFLGGARFPRPRCEAMRVPKDLIKCQG